MSLMISVSGIRGIVDQSINAETVGDFAAAFGTCLGGRKVVIGRDSRLSGAAFRDQAVEMLTRCGCQVVDLGVVTTPRASNNILPAGPPAPLTLSSTTRSLRPPIRAGSTMPETVATCLSWVVGSSMTQPFCSAGTNLKSRVSRTDRRIRPPARTAGGEPRRAVRRRAPRRCRRRLRPGP